MSLEQLCFQFRETDIELPCVCPNYPLPGPFQSSLYPPRLDHHFTIVTNLSNEVSAIYVSIKIAPLLASKLKRIFYGAIVLFWIPSAAELLFSIFATNNVLKYMTTT